MPEQQGNAAEGKHPPIDKLVSGGQTGVDRAALDAALRLSIPIGGWCPRGRLAEDGRIPPIYSLYETATGDVAVRTELNVLDSDGTLILTTGTPIDGTVLTRLCAEQHARPFLEISLDNPIAPEELHGWLKRHQIRVLNVAGPRESHRPGFVYKTALKFLLSALSQA
jgi:hypothetical protein